MRRRFHLEMYPLILKPSTTLVMPAAPTTVTANYGFTPPAVTTVPQPVAGHPRLWLTPADLPRLQSWAVPTNPIYQDGILPLLGKCVSDFNTQFFPNGAPNPVYPDFGDSQGYTGLLTEQYMLVFALNALIDPSPTARMQYAQDAHDLMMYAMNQAVQGPQAGAPFRDPSFPIYNRASFTSEAWPLTVDWIYDATNAVQGGAPSLPSRVQNPWTWGVQDSLFLFLLPDLSATTTDPRPNYPTAFYDAGQGRLIERTDWSPGATMFDLRCSWESINHQQGDANQFEFYRKGEWLTKGVANYDDNDNGQSSDYHNTLTLQNWCANGTPANLLWEAAFWTNGSQWPLALSAGDPATYASVQTAYTYAFGDATRLYNRPSYWTPANAALDILHASRSIIWLKPDHIVVYDRATSHTAGLFKQFNLAFPTAPALNGNLIQTTTPGGQNLYVTSLLPASSTFTSVPIAGALTFVADLEPCQFRMVIQAPSNPTDERFLHVLQGADAGVQPDNATLVQTTAGTPMDGAVVGNTAVLFVVDATAPFSGATCTVPANVNQHFITGCAPNAFYNVSSSNVANGLVVTIAPAAAGLQADAAGVLPVSF
jgi:hypothetical protein